MAGNRIVTRRTALMAGGGALLLGACDAHSSSSPSPSPVAQWVSSDVLTAGAPAPDMAALNRQAGLVTGAQRRDPYGPYLPLVLPKGHAIYTAAPKSPDQKAMATQPMSYWREQLARAAGPFITHVADPAVLWTHEQRPIDAHLQALANALADPGTTMKVNTATFYGHHSFLNSDGTLATQLGATPRPRTNPGPRFGAQGLVWSVVTSKDGTPALGLAVTLKSPVVANGFAYTWSRKINMIVADLGAAKAGDLNIDFPCDDDVSVPVDKPLDVLPRLQQLGLAPSDWQPHAVDGLTLSTPAGWNNTTNPDDEPGTHRLGAGKQFCTVRRLDPIEPGWYAGVGQQNTQFSIGDNIPVLSEWGHNNQFKTYLCSSWIYAPTACYEIRFTTTADTSATDLRQHAATWSIKS